MLSTPFLDDGFDTYLVLDDTDDDVSLILAVVCERTRVPHRHATSCRTPSTVETDHD